MSWWEHFSAAGAQVEAQAAELTPPMPAGSMPMIVGVYVGLVLGTMEAEHAGRLRRELEAELASAMRRPPEALEEEMRQLLGRISGARG